MSFLTAAKQTLLKRPIVSSIVTVGIVLLSWFLAADPITSKPVVSRKMHIESIPMCKFFCACDTIQLLTRVGEGSGNNYAYLVTDDKSKDAVIIDPANPPE